MIQVSVILASTKTDAKPAGVSEKVFTDPQTKLWIRLTVPYKGCIEQTGFFSALTLADHKDPYMLLSCKMAIQIYEPDT